MTHEGMGNSIGAPMHTTLPKAGTRDRQWGHGLRAHLAMLIRKLQPQPHTDQAPLEKATFANISRLPETSNHYP